MSTRDAEYGLGLKRYLVPGGVEIVGHMGDTAGYRAFMFQLPAQDIDIAMAINNPGDPMPVLTPALKLLVAAAA